MTIGELFSHFAVALGIGLLIGIERGWATRDEAAGTRTAGLRTFTITGLLGGTIGAMARSLGEPSGVAAALVLGLGFAAFAAVITIFVREENRAEKKFSATTAIAAMVTFALGAYTMVGDFRVAAAAAVATAILLALRTTLHGWIKGVSWPELRSGLMLLAMTCIGLPIVPNDPVGPFGGVNPRDIWLTAIVLASVSFLGYAAVRYLGARHGILLSAAAGGLASSTAVTLTNARRAGAGEGAPRLLAAGVSLAAAISFGRVLAIVVVLGPGLLPVVAPPLAAAGLAATAFALVVTYWRHDRKAAAPRTKVRNPFSFWPVVGLAVLLALMVLAGRALSDYAGPAWLLLGAAILGFADVDAVTVSMANLGGRDGAWHIASYGILIAAVSNTLSKVAAGFALGGRTFATLLATAAAAAIAAGAAAFYATMVVFGFAA